MFIHINHYSGLDADHRTSCFGFDCLVFLETKKVCEHMQKKKKKD